ncbi:hypothetical protein DINM_000205 [Dirofilaria immitis]|nr:hypothetical protein [Dirofilaria immitis]
MSDDYAMFSIQLRHLQMEISNQGLLTGYVLSDRILYSLSPIAALTPCFIGIITPLSEPTINKQRSLLLIAAIIGSFTFHIIIGMLFNLTFPYILLVISYTVIGFITLQLLIANVDENMAFTHLYQLAILYLSLLAEFFVYKLFGKRS